MTKVRTNFKDAKRDIARFKRIAKASLSVALKGEIKQSIERGVSPVKGEGRFAKYSESYGDAIKAGKYKPKRVRPVNLKLTGVLLNSLKVLVIKSGLRISFDNKLADIHNREGAGKSKTKRRMLPTNNGEQFSRSITMRMKEVLNRVAKTIFNG